MTACEPHDFNDPHDHYDYCPECEEENMTENAAPDPFSEKWVEERSEDWQALYGSLTEVRKANGKVMESVSRTGASIEPTSVLANRLAKLIDTLMPIESEERMRFELAFEATMGEMLAKVVSEVRRAQLSPSSNNGSGIIVPGGPS